LQVGIGVAQEKLSVQLQMLPRRRPKLIQKRWRLGASRQKLAAPAVFALTV
jgi:hypothetical protein